MTQIDMDEIKELREACVALVRSPICVHLCHLWIDFSSTPSFSAIWNGRWKGRYPQFTPIFADERPGDEDDRRALVHV
jgi:hypothetical protein